ncbi:DUF222 domain-containing protein [Amycolatopsis mediterranei]|uniref:DUF222 domain-containing protein n=1 Tax=Amycolatopsis mediterranei TaxID=33910 RepID=UPI003F4D81D9
MSDNEALSSSDAAALADRIGELVACMRSAEAELGALLVEIEQRGVMELFGYRSAARLLEHLADIPKQTGERLVKRARVLHPGRNLDGSPIPAFAPATGVAARAGRLSTPMIDVITGVLTQVPPEHHASVEQNLRSFAADAGHKQVAALGARILAHLAPDGAEPDTTEPVAPTREVFLRRKRTGIWELNGTPVNPTARALNCPESPSTSTRTRQRPTSACAAKGRSPLPMLGLPGTGPAPPPRGRFGGACGRPAPALPDLQGAGGHGHPAAASAPPPRRVCHWHGAPCAPSGTSAAFADPGSAIL